MTESFSSSTNSSRIYTWWSSEYPCLGECDSNSVSVSAGCQGRKVWELCKLKFIAQIVEATGIREYLGAFEEKMAADLWATGS